MRTPTSRTTKQAARPRSKVYAQTSIKLEPEVKMAIERAAFESGKTQTAVINDTLRASLGAES